MTPRRLTIEEVELLVEPGYFQRGIQWCDRGRVLAPARWGRRIWAEVDEHRVTVVVDENVKAACSCNAIRRTPVCTHAAALLVAWARNPRDFRARAPERKPKPARRPAPPDRGLGALRRVLDELARSGLAHPSEERLAELRESTAALRAGGLRRLAGRVSDFHALLRDGSATAAEFTDLVLECEEPGEPEIARGLRLVEVHFDRRKTSDGFRIEESHLFEPRTGRFFADLLIVPAARTWLSKRSFGAIDVREARIEPGPPPRRIRLDDFEEGPADLAEAIAAALSVRQAAAAFDFPATPVLLRSAGIVPHEGGFALVDGSGDAIALECGGIPPRRIARALEGQALYARLVFRRGDLRAEPLSTIRRDAVISWKEDPL